MYKKCSSEVDRPTPYASSRHIYKQILPSLRKSIYKLSDATQTPYTTNGRSTYPHHTIPRCMKQWENLSHEVRRFMHERDSPNVSYIRGRDRGNYFTILRSRSETAAEVIRGISCTETVPALGPVMMVSCVHVLIVFFLLHFYTSF